MTENTDPLSPVQNHRFIGHTKVEAALFEACRSHHLHHSLILAGPQGIGKATLAYRLARHLLKPEEGGLLGLEPEGADNFDMSPEDPVFRQVAAGGHPSLKLVERARNADTGKLARDITVADIRALSDFYRMTSVAGSWRIAIVDPAEAMNQNAANALLKILEEPPERCVLILISHAPGRLLPTIRSRCHFVQMSALSAPEMATALDALGIGVGGVDIELLAALSEGSVGDASRIVEMDGLALHRDIQALMGRRGAPFDGELDSLCDRMTKKGQDETFELFTRLMERSISDKIVAMGRAGSVAKPGGDLDRWLDVWEKVRVLFAQASGLGLDRKHVILNAFLHVSGAATSTPER
jgi:DNA polymerase III subunit delta'